MSRANLSKAQHGVFAPGPSAATREQTPVPRATAPFVHLCACGRWGAFGIGVFRGVAGRWFCADHVPPAQA